MAPRRWGRHFLLAVVTLVAAGVAGAGAARVVTVVTPAGPSHIMNVRKVAAELASRGHDVLVRGSEFRLARSLYYSVSLRICLEAWRRSDQGCTYQALPWISSCT